VCLNGESGLTETILDQFELGFFSNHRFHHISMTEFSFVGSVAMERNRYGGKLSLESPKKNVEEMEV
jgi:hypothetical protein